MNSSEAAAWVQAIGSILAILVAIYVSAKQFADAIDLQARVARQERRIRYETLIGLIDAALDDFSDTLQALKGAEPLRYFEENSTHELMDEFYQAFVQISPLDMPSAAAARSIVTLRDRLKTAAWNAKTAIDDYTPSSPNEYQQCLMAMEHNLNEVKQERETLNQELTKI